MVQKKTYGFICLLFLLLSAVPVSAQDGGSDSYDFEFRGETLAQVLDKIARETDIDLIYDPLLVKGADTYGRFRNQSIQHILQSVLSRHNLDYLTLSSGTVVIIKKAAETPSFGSFTGKVLDSRTGEPLPGASVMIADAAGGTSTGRSGTFSLSQLLSGEYRITFSYIGYRAVTKTVRVPPGGQINDTINLQPESFLVAPVIVESHQPRFFEYESGKRQSDGRDRLVADDMRGPIRDLSLVPGVRHGLPMNGIQLQGGQQSDHRFMLDGVPVYNPYAVGKMYSAVSPNAIGRVALHRAGYGAEVGSHMSGVIDLSHEVKGNGSKGVELTADLLSLSVKGDYSIDYENGSKLAAMSAVRTSTWDTYRDPVLERSLRNWNRIDPLITNKTADFEEDAALYAPEDQRTDLDFYDIHGAVRYELSPFNELYGSFYASGNTLGTAVLNRADAGATAKPYLFAAESYRWNNRLGQLRWNSLVTPRIDLTTQVMYSYGSFGHGGELGTSSAPIQLSSRFNTLSSATEADVVSNIRLPSSLEGNSIKHFSAVSEMTYSFSSSASGTVGLRADRVVSGVDVNEGDYLPIFADVKSTMVGSHLSGSYRFGEYWKLSLGSRFTYLDKKRSLYAEPRVSLQYDEPDSRIGNWSARLSGGLYRQFINQYSVTNTGATAVVPSFSIWSHAGTAEIPKSYHLASSWYAAFSEASTLRIEAFYKWQPVTNITSYKNLIAGESLDRSEVQAFAESTEMRVLGGSLRASRWFDEGTYSVTLGYDYSYTRLNMESQFGKTVPAPWSDPHRAHLRAMVHLSPELTAAAKWQGVWGRSWAFRDSYYNFLQVTDTEPTPDRSFSTPGNDRLSPFLQADLSLMYQPSAGGTEVDIRLDLINIFNRENALDRRLEPERDDGTVTGYKPVERAMPGFYPRLSLQVKL